MAVDGWGESEAERQQAGDGWQVGKDRDLGVTRQTLLGFLVNWGAGQAQPPAKFRGAHLSAQQCNYP